MAKYESVSFHASSGLLENLRTRGESPGIAAKRDLEFYYALLERSLDELQADTSRLSENEALLLMDSLNGVLCDPQTFYHMWAGVEDSIRLEGLDKKWKVDGKKLIEKLRHFTPAETLAVIDAIDRAWRSGKDGREAMKAVGLIRDRK